MDFFISKCSILKYRCIATCIFCNAMHFQSSYFVMTKQVQAALIIRGRNALLRYREYWNRELWRSTEWPNKTSHIPILSLISSESRIREWINREYWILVYFSKTPISELQGQPMYNQTFVQRPPLDLKVEIFNDRLSLLRSHWLNKCSNSDLKMVVVIETWLLFESDC